MKKTILSLAALMIAMTATVMTSCSNEALDEVAPVEEEKSNVVTITIAPPVAEPETRVTIDESTDDSKPKSFKISGWEEGDVVKVYEVNGTQVSDGVVFTCANSASGTFTGTLPEGKTLNDYHVAVYGHDIQASLLSFPGFSDNMVSSNLKDVIFMAGEISGGRCTMKICNNIIKVNNKTGTSFEVAWYYNDSFVDQYFLLHDEDSFAPISATKPLSYDKAKHLTIPTGISYISMNPTSQSSVSLRSSENRDVIPMKDFSAFEFYTVGKLFTHSIIIATGTAQRTGNIDVNWVQLWEDGPKFAEYNVGAANNNAEDSGGYYCWGGSVDKGKDANSGVSALSGDSDTATKLWGSNWRMPTKEELDALVANCTNEWTTVEGVSGRKFTGKKGIFKNNSVFLPAASYYLAGSVSSTDGGGYWTSTHSSGENPCALTFTPSSNPGKVISVQKNLGFSVRAVLAE